MNLYMLLLLIVESISIAAFTYLSILFIRVYRRIKSESILFYTIFILLLLLGQLCGILSTVVSNARIAATLYVASSSLAVAGFMIMLFSSFSSNELYIVIPIFIASPDILAGILSTVFVIESVRGRTRYFISILSASYYIRGIGTLLTAFQGSLLALLISETIRASAVVLLALHHTAQVLAYCEEKR